MCHFAIGTWVHLDVGHFISKQNQMTAYAEAPAKNANGGLINVPGSTGEAGFRGNPRSHMPWNSGRLPLLSLAPKPSFVLTGYQASWPGSMEVVFIYLDLFM